MLLPGLLLSIYPLETCMLSECVSSPSRPSQCLLSLFYLNVRHSQMGLAPFWVLYGN